MAVTGNDELAKKVWKKAYKLAKGNIRLIQKHSEYDITVHNNEDWQMNRNLHAIENRNEDHKLDLLLSEESERNQSRTYEPTSDSVD